MGRRLRAYTEATDFRPPPFSPCFQALRVKQLKAERSTGVRLWYAAGLRGQPGEAAVFFDAGTVLEFTGGGGRGLHSSTSQLNLSHV